MPSGTMPRNTEPEVILYSAKVCPFAHRTRLTAAEKGISRDVVEIDLNNMPEWFSRLSPYGRVPLLRHGDNLVWESTIINEYLDEVFPEPPLLPKEPGPRALARIWIDYANNRFLPSFYSLLTTSERSKGEDLAGELRETLQDMEERGLSGTEGPYWMGEKISLADIAFYPFFERFPVLEHYRDFRLPQECRNIRRWLAAMRERPSVKIESKDPDFYIGAYAEYAQSGDKRT